jgi:hypothetical protein
MNATETPEPARPRKKGLTPFTIFGLVAALAAAGAIWEMSYYAGTSAIAPAALGTTLGVVVATAIFFVLGARAAPNE